MLEIYSKLAIKIPTLSRFHPLFWCFIVDFEQVNAGWDIVNNIFLKNIFFSNLCHYLRFNIPILNYLTYGSKFSHIFKRKRSIEFNGN